MPQTHRQADPPSSGYAQRDRVQPCLGESGISPSSPDLSAEPFACLVPRSRVNPPVLQAHRETRLDDLLSVHVEPAGAGRTAAITPPGQQLFAFFRFGMQSHGTEGRELRSTCSRTGDTRRITDHSPQAGDRHDNGRIGHGRSMTRRKDYEDRSSRTSRWVPRHQGVLQLIEIDRVGARVSDPGSRILQYDQYVMGMPRAAKRLTAGRRPGP